MIPPVHKEDTSLLLCLCLLSSVTDRPAQEGFSPGRDVRGCS